jgi:hypothetical protein
VVAPDTAESENATVPVARDMSRHQQKPQRLPSSARIFRNKEPDLRLVTHTYCKTPEPPESLSYNDLLFVIA